MEVAVRTPGLGEAASQLPWLSPGAASLVALARAPTVAAWEEIRSDPGCVLLVLREALPRQSVSGISFFPALLADPAVLEAALRYLDGPGAGYVDWNEPALQPIYRAGLLYARAARLIAEQADCCALDNAWVCGLLAPLGWMAAAAVDPALTAACLVNKSICPERSWGLDPCAIARRLCHAWRLPAWLAAVCGHLALPVGVAQTLGADPALFQVAQLAVGLVQEQRLGLEVAVPAPTEAAAALGLTSGEVDVLRTAISAAGKEPMPSLSWEPPPRTPLLVEVLGLAAQNLRLANLPALDGLQRDVDKLQRALVEQRRGEHERLEALKLAGLAEVAAGAGHEINNPLAVISGQAQYLLAHEEDPARRRALQTITSQAQRIHQILIDLMQYARPPAPHRQVIDVPGLIRDVAESLAGLANERKVRLVCPEPAEPHAVHADPAQARTALGALLRNAIEAAPAEGWAGVRVESHDNTLVHLIVEDNGRGLTPTERQHVFDPFFSGRKAGRGRGLGLSTAWRLARQHAGDVHFDESVQTPTRFVLTLPRAPLPDIRPAIAEPPQELNGANGCHIMAQKSA
jgi:signal transduction histidine kinase